MSFHSQFVYPTFDRWIFFSNSRSCCFCGISVSQIDSQIKSIHKHSNIPGLRLKEIHKSGLNQKHPSPTINKLKLQNIMNVGSNFNSINIYNTLKVYTFKCMCLYLKFFFSYTFKSCMKKHGKMLLNQDGLCYDQQNNLFQQ